ncbi:MAG: hypothetical protein QNJ56_06825 [Gammaproteobacteria bacterium]|nr:hypothetical protein [Gammaproteobacteria bacterium]
MGIKKQAQEAVTELESLATDHWTDKEKNQAAKIIEQAIIQTVNEFCDTSSKAVDQCCSADQDKAHKLNEEIELARTAIIANLSSLR